MYINNFHTSLSKTGGFMTDVQVGNINVGKGNPLVLIAGPCVIESEKLCFEVAERVKLLSEKYELPFIFKASYKFCMIVSKLSTISMSFTYSYLKHIMKQPTKN